LKKLKNNFPIMIVVNQMNSKTGHKIKQRNTANDVFITPKALSKKAIDMVMDIGDCSVKNAVWYDPFKNSGSYYNQFPCEERDKRWSEILDGRDFFKFTIDDWNPTKRRGMEKYRVICSNPPYSILDDVFKHSIALEPNIINYLIGVNNLTPRRIEMFEKAGYSLTKFHLCKVYKWYGMSVIVQFRKPAPEQNVITYDRIVWREDED
jgi:hypothetical protein